MSSLHYDKTSEKAKYTLIQVIDEPIMNMYNKYFDKKCNFFGDII